MKKALFIFILMIALFFPKAQVKAQPSGVVTDANSLIAAVNQLRAANGLAPYTPNAILMGVAQAHADYMAATGNVSHTGAGGSNVTGRMLAAGYSVAGDLSLGGIRAENITAGPSKSVYDAVLEWQGDAPHLNTMLHPLALDIGAGVAYKGDTVYYVIDVALRSNNPLPTLPGGTPGLVGTPVVYAPPLVSTVIPVTPNAEGKLIHTVKGGETLWLIAITYGVTVAEIRSLNGMSEADAIYPGEVILIKKDLPTNSPAAPSATATVIVSETPTAFASPTLISLPTASPTPEPEITISLEENNNIAVGLILFTALILALLLARSFVSRE